MYPHQKKTQMKNNPADTNPSSAPTLTDSPGVSVGNTTPTKSRAETPRISSKEIPYNLALALILFFTVLGIVIGFFCGLSFADAHRPTTAVDDHELHTKSEGLEYTVRIVRGSTQGPKDSQIQDAINQSSQNNYVLDRIELQYRDKAIDAIIIMRRSP